MIDDRVRMVLARAVVPLVVLLVVLLVVVASGVWLPAEFRTDTSCPVHVPGQTPWPGVPPKCLAGW